VQQYVCLANNNGHGVCAMMINLYRFIIVGRESASTCPVKSLSTLQQRNRSPHLHELESTLLYATFYPSVIAV